MIIQIDKRIIRDIGPALSLALPGLKRGDVRLDSDRLVFAVPVDEAVVAGVVAGLEAQLPPVEQLAETRQYWPTGIMPKRRYGRQTAANGLRFKGF